MPSNSSYCTLLLGILAIALTGFFASFGISWRLVNVGYAWTPAVAWIMVGGVTSTSAVLKIKLPLEDAHQGNNNVLLYLSPNQDFSLPQEYHLGDTAASELEQQYGLQTLQVSNLQPQTKYYYRIQGMDSEYTERLQGTFTTPATEGTRFNFTIAASSCAMTGSRASVFREIQKVDPLLFLHVGDFHYADIDTNDMTKRIDAISQVMASDTQADLYRSTAISYTWDDHDWLGNNANGVEEYEGARDTALLSYQMAFPHYPLPALSTIDNNSTTTAPVVPNTDALLPAPVYHAYTIGTVRFIISDLRSESTKEAMYSTAQAEWLRQELRQAHLFDFVIWVTAKPWIGPQEAGEDKWYGYPEERADLSAFITETLGEGPQNLLAISGDAHMVAFDDGTNTYYGNNETTTSRRSFPILQTSSMDRVGGVKGGPFTDGCYGYEFQRSNQFSVLRFEFADGEEDDDNDKCIHIDTYRKDQYASERELLFSKRLCNQIFSDAVVADDEAKVGVCELDQLRDVNDNLALAATLILLATMIFTYIAIYYNLDGNNLVGCFCKSCGTTIFYIVSYLATGMVGFGTFFARGVDQVDATPVLIVMLCQSCLWFLYLFIWWLCCTQSQQSKTGHHDPEDGVADQHTTIDIFGNEGANTHT
ncbi:PhoD-like phosphatase [Seminavis robusta]|uniref:PhoD-like phosphatase n=1 Tax=Seminavis robusta TaxID=568900 RepID=A0A9N8DN78_9STRA|nr:PhoD-like phosphatase [Seminavis robusta]|eukprot:Sro241_g096300.1 PhoD-like phosphatase (648) ;mRNA; f:30750-32693